MASVNHQRAELLLARGRIAPGEFAAVANGRHPFSVWKTEDGLTFKEDVIQRNAHPDMTDGPQS